MQNTARLRKPCHAHSARLGKPCHRDPSRLGKPCDGVPECTSYKRHPPFLLVNRLPACHTDEYAGGDRLLAWNLCHFCRRRGANFMSLKSLLRRSLPRCVPVL